MPAAVKIEGAPNVSQHRGEAEDVGARDPEATRSGADAPAGAHAEEKLAAADAGSLFDLKGSTGRAEEIARAVLKRLKEAK